MAIFILTSPTDTQALQVAWGLRAAGHEIVSWDGLGWEKGRQASIAIGAGGAVILNGREITSRDTVWLRKPRLSFEHPGVSPEDAKFAANQYSAFNETLLLHIENTGAFCVNKGSSAILLENKSIQLAWAQQCNLQIPATLMTNCYNDLCQWTEDSGHDLVHKSFVPHLWIDKPSRQAYFCGTAQFDLGSLKSSEIVAYAPAIYQQRVNKQFDSRITMIGSDLHACRIEVADPLDWRLQISSGRGKVYPVDIPAEVENALRNFALRTGIVFGCFDMSVDQDGRWWFLEVNQSGQFLWIDGLDPSARLYQRMLAFLAAREETHPKTAEEFPSYAECQSRFTFAREPQPLDRLEVMSVEGVL